MKRWKFGIPIFILGLFLIFLVWESILFLHVPFQIFCEKKSVLFSDANQNLFVFGDKNSPELQLAMGQRRSFLKKTPVPSLEDFEVGKEFSSGQLRFQIFSKNIVRGIVSQDKKISAIFWIWNEPSEEEISQVKQQPISFESDFWILGKSVFPDFFPMPKQAILFLGERKPSKKISQFAQEKNIPLVSVNDTGGFSVTLEQGQWQLRTRK